MAKNTENTINIEEYYKTFGRENICSYCLESAETIDHTVPRSHVKEHFRAYRNFLFMKVPCCLSCNLILGNNVFQTFIERKTHIANYLIKKYKKDLTALQWSQDELDDLGFNLQSFMKKRFAVAKLIQRRIYHLQIKMPPPKINNDLFCLRKYNDYNEEENS